MRSRTVVKNCFHHQLQNKPLRRYRGVHAATLSSALPSTTPQPPNLVRPAIGFPSFQFAQRCTSAALDFVGMGSCFSSPQNQQSHATQTPASYAAAVAQSAAHAVSDFIQDQAGNAGAPPNAHSANAQQTNPSGLQVINNAYVFKMPDGDTFTCDYTDHAGQKVTARVRIMAIDCPESNQNFGQDARQIGEKLIFRTNVTLHVHTTDRYGRLVADVITQSGLNFGEEMLRQGAAWHYKAYDKRQNLAQLEVDAREARIGLWAFPRPQEPWEYRRRKRQAAN